ncbi:hypothetical protein E3P91_03788 [Wallemia ichthyophaga]|nr:hypothetical protein E3P91_03788 [Wallemia ichthyophaga]TIB58882.1 hypothetical protein E3P78_03760 [Wallemia ichthyophaga]
MNHEQATLNRTGSLPNKQFHVNSLNDIDPHQSIDDLEREIEYTRLSNQGIRRHQSLTYGHKNYPIKLEHYDQPSRRNNKKLNLITDFNDLSIPAQPASASAYVPPIGHSSGMHQHPTHIHQPPPPPLSATAALWNNQDRQSVVGMAPSSQWRFDPITGQPLTPPPPPPKKSLHSRLRQQHQPINTPLPPSPPATDIHSMIAMNGYNPTQFDLNPKHARFFVIKSYTEDDVHKSLKYNIWASTELGNQRLDKAFNESANKGPIYLFFSVNASGHFCGMAQMLTHVDYATSSSVWSQNDKWKGVFKLRWIFIKDIPNSTLRHIKLLNTNEKKPVTNSRDTTELLDDAGKEMLNIFFQFNSRTSLLQDFDFYEIQSIQKGGSGGSGGVGGIGGVSSGVSVGSGSSTTPTFSPPNQPLHPAYQFQPSNPYSFANLGQQGW